MGAALPDQTAFANPRPAIVGPDLIYSAASSFDELLATSRIADIT
jgi:hypothetical protein